MPRTGDGCSTGSRRGGTIYARPGTKRVTLAPSHREEDYFAKLFQRLDLAVADA